MQHFIQNSTSNNPPDNIANGALGVLSAHTVAMKHVAIPEDQQVHGQVKGATGHSIGLSPLGASGLFMVPLQLISVTYTVKNPIYLSRKSYETLKL